MSGAREAPAGHAAAATHCPGTVCQCRETYFKFHALFRLNSVVYNEYHAMFDLARESAERPRKRAENVIFEASFAQEVCSELNQTWPRYSLYRTTELIGGIKCENKFREDTVPGQ